MASADPISQSATLSICYIKVLYSELRNEMAFQNLWLVKRRALGVPAGGTGREYLFESMGFGTVSGAFEAVDVKFQIACKLNGEAFLHLGLHDGIVLTLFEQLHDARAVQQFEWVTLAGLPHVNSGLTGAAFARGNKSIR